MEEKYYVLLAVLLVFLTTSINFWLISKKKKPQVRMRNIVSFDETIKYLTSLINNEAERQIKFNIVCLQTDKDLRPSLINTDTVSKFENFAVANVLTAMSPSYVNELQYFIAPEHLEKFIFEKIHDQLFEYTLRHNTAVIAK